MYARLTCAFVLALTLVTPALPGGTAKDDAKKLRGTWTLVSGERLKLGPVRPVPERTDLAPGELAVSKHSVLAGTGSHAVELGEVRAVGKKPMAAADWARGVRPEPGTRLGV